VQNNNILNILIPALISLIGAALTAYFGLRGKRTEQRSVREIAQLETETTEEVEFQKRLLELIKEQGQEIKAQDEKIHRLELAIDSRGALVDDLKRANWMLTLENQQLKRRQLEQDVEIAALTRQLADLRKEVQGG
jgi:hypothetical protein